MTQTIWGCKAQTLSKCRVQAT